MAAVLAAALGVCTSGGLVAAAAAWSDSGPLAHIASGHRHGHGRGNGGGAGSGGATTTTVITTVTTTTTTRTTTAATTSTTKRAAAAKPKAKPKPKPKPKPVNQLTATQASAAAFPDRELGLWTSLPTTLTAGQVHITENGQPVRGLTLEPLSGAAGKSFGVVVVLDESSSLTLNTRELELSTAAAIAQKRTGQQAFGLVTFSAYPTVMLPLTTNQSLITAGLETAPLLAPGSSVVPALSMAYAALHRAGMATGAVIVVTAGKDLAAPAQEAAASQAGLKLGYRTFTTDVLAAPPIGAPAGKTSASGDSDAAQERALGQQLASAADIWTKLSAGYLVSYRSSAKPGENVTVSVSVDGVQGAPTFGYTATASPAAPVASVPPLSQLPALMGQPGFARFVPAAAPVVPRQSSPFWSSPVSLLAVSFLCATLLAGALWLLVGGVGRSELETRVASFIPDGAVVDDPAVLALATTPGVPPILARRRWWPGFALQVDIARFHRSPVTLVKLAVAGSLVAFVLLMLIWGMAAGLFLGLPLGPVVLWALLRRAVRRTRTRFSDQLPSALQDMAGAVRGGRSLAGALLAVTDGADQPILGEFERVIADEQLGRPLEDSIQTGALRMESEDMRQVALVARLHRRSGSSVAEALDHVADGARERAELKRELKSLTGQARLSSRILTALPVALFFAMSLLEPSYMRPVTHSTGGLVVLGLCGGMVVLGWLAMKRIVKVEA